MTTTTTTTTIDTRQGRTPSAVLTDRFARALTYSSAIHAPLLRQDGRGDTMAHLLATAGLVLQSHGDEDLAIAALLHDAVEACGGVSRLDDIRARFGDRVADAVHGCSTTPDEARELAAGLWERAQEQLDRMAHSSDDVLAVWLAVMTQNARRLAVGVHHRTGDPRQVEEIADPSVARLFEEALRIGRQRGLPDALTVPLSMAVEDLLAVAGPTAQPAVG